MGFAAGLAVAVAGFLAAGYLESSSLWRWTDPQPRLHGRALPVGLRAPDFRLHDGRRTIGSEALRGRPYVVAFTRGTAPRLTGITVLALGPGSRLEPVAEVASLARAFGRPSERLFAVDAEGFLRASYPASVPAAGLAADLEKLGRGEAPGRRKLVLHLPHAAMTLLGSVVLLWIWLATSPRRAGRTGPPPPAS